MHLDKKINQRTAIQTAVQTNTAGLIPPSYQRSRLVNKHEAAGILGISPETLKKYRLQENSPLIEGVHYHVWNSRTIRYDAELLADWGLNRNRPELHRQTIEIYLTTLASSKKSKRGFLYRNKGS